MSDFLKKIKLMDNLNVELNISKLEFVKALRNHIEISDLGLFSDFSDIFSSTKKEFKGKVDNKGFVIKRRRRLVDSKRNSTAKALGSFKEIENKLIINSEIKGINNKMCFFIVSAIMFYSVFISVFLLEIIRNEGGIIIVAILFHASLMFGIPYLFMRVSVKRLKKDLETEFYLLVNNFK